MSAPRIVLALLIAAAPPAALANTPVPVGVETARTGSIAEEVALNGTLLARRIARLSPETDGLVTEVLVDDGDRVAAGAVVVRLDRRLARIALAAADARLAEARARHAEAERRHTELEELQASRHVADTSVASARAQIEIEAALVRQAAAELERAEELLTRHDVRAPFAAVVQHKRVERGEWVETGSVVAELVDVEVLRLEVPVPQFYFGDVAAGTPASIRFDALPERVFEAAVTRRIAVSDPASRTFRARIELPNDSGLLAPGMSARVTLRIGDPAAPPALLLPRDAVVRKPDGSASVWVVVEEDGVSKAVPRAVQTGRAYREHVEVVEGDISAGERVVVRGNEILRPGQSVSVAAERAGDI